MKTVKKGGSARNADAAWVTGGCLCGDVEVAIGFPARWAWHDHSAASRRAHGAAYATYVGSWRSRFRVTKGEAKIGSSMPNLAPDFRFKSAPADRVQPHPEGP